MARKGKYKPIKEENFWEARGRYEDMKQSGELYKMDPKMVGLWAYDMPKFLELDETLKTWDEEKTEEPIDSKENKGVVWYNKNDLK